MILNVGNRSLYSFTLNTTREVNTVMQLVQEAFASGLRCFLGEALFELLAFLSDVLVVLSKYRVVVLLLLNFAGGRWLLRQLAGGAQSQV